MQNWLTIGDQQENDSGDDTSPQIVELEEDKNTDEIDVSRPPYTLDEQPTEPSLSYVHKPLGSDKPQAAGGPEPELHRNKSKIEKEGKILTQ